MTSIMLESSSLSARLIELGFTVEKGQDSPQLEPGKIVRHGDRVIVGPLHVLGEDQGQTFTAELSQKLIEDADALSKLDQSGKAIDENTASMLIKFRRYFFNHIVMSLSAAGYAVGDDVDKIVRCLRCDVFVVASEDFEARNAFTRVFRSVFSLLFGVEAVPLVNTVFVSALPNNAVVSSVFEYVVNDNAKSP